MSLTTIANKLLIIIMLAPFAVVLQSSLLLNKKDTRLMAREWVEKNLSAETGIIADINAVRLWPTHHALMQQSAFDGNHLKAWDRVLLNAYQNDIDISEFGFKPVFNVLHTHQSQIKNETQKRLQQSGLESLIKIKNYSYLIIEQRAEQTVPKWHQDIIGKNLKLASGWQARGCGRQPPYLRSTVLVDQSVFCWFGFERFGPDVSIYQLN